MDPSSLIFVAIVAIWAVYLLGHWARRRDLLATARSVDRFSEAMRVLERRTPQPLSTSRSSAPVRTATRPAPAPQRPAAQPPAPQRPAPQGRPVPQGRPAPRSARPDAATRRARALVLLGLLVLVPTTWLLAALTSVSAWLPVVLTLALAGQLLHLRRVTIRRRRLARSRARAGRRPNALPPHAAVPRPRTEATPRPAARPGESAPADVGQAPARDSAPADTDQGEPAHAAEPKSTDDNATDGKAPGDNAPTAAGTPAADREAASATTTAGGWQPVPVPPPTYTLKPKAPAPVQRPAPAAPATTADERRPGLLATTGDATPTSAPPEFDLDEILERRIASGG